jgi:circadian clock protein KaiB
LPCCVTELPTAIPAPPRFPRLRPDLPRCARGRRERPSRILPNGPDPGPAAARKDDTLSKYLLRLYVTGKTPRAEKAIANLRRICDEDLHGRYELQIIDVLQDPQKAEDEKILATPTLIKRLPPPLRRVIGDLSDREKVLLGLEVWPAEGEEDLAPEADAGGETA